MDYDEWTPLGRGDPLKNNPTFDYVPPVLDRVQYWLDSHTTEPSSKRDILVLGVTAKKTSPKIPEQFLQFVDGPKFTRAGQDAPYRNEFTGSSGAEPPKIVRTTSFRNGLIDYRNQNRLQALPASYYPSPYYGQKMKPYTMMMPPPYVQKAETSTNYNVGVPKDKVIGYVDTSQPFSTQTEEGPLLQDAQYHGAPSKDYAHYSPAPSSRPYSTKTPPNKGVAVSHVETIKSVYTPTASQSTKSRYEATTAPSVSFEKSNLIYQSTQTLSGGWLGSEPISSSSTGFPDVNQVTWQTPDYSKDHYEVDYHAAASSNHEVVVGQNANIIVDGNSNENEEVVMGQKETTTEATSSTSESLAQSSTVSSSTVTVDSTDLEDEQQGMKEAVTEAQTSQKMHIVLANSPSTMANLETHTAKKGPVTVVMPTNYVERNASSSSSDPLTTVHNALGNPITSEMTKTTHQASKMQAQPTSNAATSSPIVETHPPATSVLNKMIPPSQLPHQPPHSPSAPVMPSRHVAGPLPIFMSPQAASQSMMHPQSRPNHAIGIHFIGSIRPGFRPSSPMSHMSPPMAHMHAPPMKTMMAPPPSMGGQAHQRPSQPFPATFSSPPSPPTMSMQTTEPEQSIDHRPSRLLATVINSMTTSAPFTPTAVPSTMEYTSIVDMDHHQESTRAPNQTPLVKVLGTEETSKTRPTLAPSSTSPPRTTTVPSLTTDPIFSHYKQPDKPISGPIIPHIIQGHSKVKTYKPSVNKLVLALENNEVVGSVTERQLSKLEQLLWQNTKNGGVDPAAEKRKLEEKARSEKRVSQQQQQHDSLMSLVESGWGESLTVEPSSAAVTTTEDERRANSVTSVEIN